MKSTFSISTLILTSLIFSGCGSGGTSVSEESFVAGDGVVTFVAQENRTLAPDINGKSLLGESTSIEKGKSQLLMFGHHGALRAAPKHQPCKNYLRSIQLLNSLEF